MLQRVVRGVGKWGLIPYTPIASHSKIAFQQRQWTQQQLHLRYISRLQQLQGPAPRVRTTHTANGNEEEEDEDELHPNWQSLERRLQSRVPRPRGEGVPEGRRNLKPSEEDFWHEAGVYEYGPSPKPPSSSSTILTGEATCARLSTVEVETANLPLVIQLYKTSISPVLQVKGFCGAQVFSDRAAGRVHSLTLWESWGALEQAVADPRYKKAMSKLAKMIEGPPSVCDTEVACCILPTTGGGDKPGSTT